MKILLFGARGFIGSALREVLAEQHEVFTATTGDVHEKNEVKADLLDVAVITRTLLDTRPDVVINCAGVVENTDRAAFNVTFTRNLLDAVIASKLTMKKILISGSAAEYGTVEDDTIAIPEDAPLHAAGAYGKSKMEEVALALQYKQKHKLPIVIARIFNPIGPGMRPKFLLPSLLAQAEKVKRGEADSMSVSRLDSIRDYCDVRDTARALQLLIEHDTEHDIYNVGSGTSTTTGELIELITKHYVIKPRIIETADHPEPPVASKADITRLTKELGWKPVKTIEQTVEEIINDQTD